ncbi:hypothetical protein BHE74_00024635 [Ensete ventricosum]|nr:hypothetical protein GW17_00047866 [Ensete ventricosum]RWW67885.1 hypothetical protein BHE74_00024635 [Ensete ventricosum]RZS03372.1 hypothetical protein BHM03_00033549 [Ensete ventricosum]
MKVRGLLKQQPITILIDTGSTNNFMNSKVVARMALHIEDCSRFGVTIADGQILKCDRRCPRVKLLWQDQEIIADFFILPLDDYEVVLGIEWLTILGNIYLIDTQVDEEAQVQLMITWGHKIMTHHHPITTVDAGPKEQDAPIIWATRKPHEEL